MGMNPYELLTSPEVAAFDMMHDLTASADALRAVRSGKTVTVSSLPYAENVPEAFSQEAVLTESLLRDVVACTLLSGEDSEHGLDFGLTSYAEGVEMTLVPITGTAMALRIDVKDAPTRSFLLVHDDFVTVAELLDPERTNRALASC